MNNRISQRIIAMPLLALLLLGQIVNAQEIGLLTLEGAKAKARENNTDLKLSESDYKIARSNYERTHAVILPQIRVTNTSTFTNNPLMAFGFKLVQRDVSAPDFDPDLLNDPGDVENYNTRIELHQPLINIDGWKERKAANIQVEISALKKQRQLEQLDLEVTRMYMQLQLAYKSVEAFQKALETSRENLKNAQNNLDQGLIQKADLLHVEVSVTNLENQLQLAESQVANVSEYLAFLIGADSTKLLVPDKDLVPNSEVEDATIELNLNRKDIRATILAAEAQKKKYGSSKMSFVPRANAMAAYEWNDSQFMGFGANNYMVGLQLSWDLFGGYKNLGKIHLERAQLEKAELQQKKYLDQSEIELNKARRQLEDARQNVDLTRLALKQSEEAMRIISNRYKQGLEKTTELLFAETQYTEKELGFYESVYNFNYAEAYLEYLTK